MKKQINLIPQNLVVPVKVVGLAKNLTRIATIISVLLLLSIVGFGGGYFYFNLEYQKISSEISDLKLRINDLERNEQKLILAKDRLSKVDYVTKIDSVDSELVSFKNFQTEAINNSAANFSETDISSSKTETSLNIKDVDGLNNVLTLLKSSKNYKKILLNSLAFNPSSGFLIDLVFND